MSPRRAGKDRPDGCSRTRTKKVQNRGVIWLNNPHLSSVRAATALEPKSLKAWAVVACSCYFLVSGAPARAADVIEPWAPGLTNAELFVGFGDSDADREVTGLGGFGAIGPRFGGPGAR